jgi:hypothetical protein
VSEWLNTPGEVAALASILAIFGAALVWLIRAVVVMSREFRPNGGSSARDQLDRIEAKVDNHITWHLDNPKK